MPFAGSKDKSYEDAGYKLMPFGYTYTHRQHMAEEKGKLARDHLQKSPVTRKKSPVGREKAN